MQITVFSIGVGIVIFILGFKTRFWELLAETEEKEKKTTSQTA